MGETISNIHKATFKGTITFPGEHGEVTENQKTSSQFKADLMTKGSNDKDQ